MAASVEQWARRWAEAHMDFSSRPSLHSHDYDNVHRSPPGLPALATAARGAAAWVAALVIVYTADLPLGLVVGSMLVAGFVYASTVIAERKAWLAGRHGGHRDLVAVALVALASATCLPSTGVAANATQWVWASAAWIVALHSALLARIPGIQLRSFTSRARTHGRMSVTQWGIGIGAPLGLLAFSIVWPSPWRIAVWLWWLALAIAVLATRAASPSSLQPGSPHQPL
ncbi:uncharacterized protein AMSG_05186 [Thecamonas trahens ATCC 50062]|uniref:Uncharacterized protein n=1 Tax=Thecamonas trahens ATCC 50062 TaxID=461836 RepID=A0A0L0DA26_THETB|nr:hypothetical protein AMSG_05186 [Thecamonas trahens ATCC 50062]KNC49204.1 hypothetical protein AMSG_05186 [Thecamonas trahens ATCC 50062]|eukprot:XP_013757927.1 hypothetical protein AMSG_05186 [Thecamonas trahens ATCC 50062]